MMVWREKGETYGRPGGGGGEGGDERESPLRRKANSRRGVESPARQRERERPPKILLSGTVISNVYKYEYFFF